MPDRLAADENVHPSLLGQKDTFLLSAQPFSSLVFVARCLLRNRYPFTQATFPYPDSTSTLASRHQQRPERHRPLVIEAFATVAQCRGANLGQAHGSLENKGNRGKQRQERVKKSGLATDCVAFNWICRRIRACGVLARYIDGKCVTQDLTWAA